MSLQEIVAACTFFALTAVGLLAYAVRRQRIAELQHRLTRLNLELLRVKELGFDLAASDVRRDIERVAAQLTGLGVKVKLHNEEPHSW